MSIGIIIISISTILIGVLSSDKFWFWALMLAITRVGASMIQVTTESYFFKKIDKDNTDMISIFRNTSPISLLIGPVIATIILTFATYQELFIILGAIVMLALVASFSLKDTK
jgi:MFS family permease